LIPTASHTDEDIRETLEAFDETKKKLDGGAYKVEAIPDMAEYSAKRFEYFKSKPKSK
jgi:glycine C-acetyltransferase